MTKSIRMLLACVISLSLAAPALADRTDDREEINTLMWRYARALDTFNPEAYAAVYTEDGSFGDGENAVKGRQALYDYMKGLADSRAELAGKGTPRPTMYHMNTDVHVEFVDETHALHHAYWITTTAAMGTEVPANVVAVGYWVDKVVKVDGKWLIRVRNASQDNL